MDASTEPQTPEEEAALRALAVTHQRWHRRLTLCCSLCVSVHTTVNLHTVWYGWPLYERDLGPLAFFTDGAMLSRASRHGDRSQPPGSCRFPGSLAPAIRARLGPRGHPDGARPGHAPHNGVR
jgi:hypothetical protein